MEISCIRLRNKTLAWNRFRRQGNESILTHDYYPILVAEGLDSLQHSWGCDGSDWSQGCSRGSTYNPVPTCLGWIASANGTKKGDRRNISNRGCGFHRQRIGSGHEWDGRGLGNAISTPSSSSR